MAVIGVSHEPHKIGYIVFDNLLSGFSGKVFGVNPNAETVLGEKLYHSVLDVRQEVDLAVICVPREIVPKVLESCGKKKIPYAIIITSGFSEVGRNGKEREAELAQIAKKHNIRLLGPNCLGVINNFNGLNASFATSGSPAKYRVGIFSQSGAMGAAMLDYANGGNFGFSYFVSLGNKLDISENDLLADWTDDKNVAVAIGYLEDIKDGEKFLKAAKKFTAKKPLIILKGGVTPAGEKAARLHTAAMAQDAAVFEAAAEEAGVILARDLNDLFELALCFSENPTPKGKRLAIISNAGGPSVLAADACAREGVPLAKLSGRTVHELSQKTEAASLENPIDLRGDAGKDDFVRALELCQKDNNVDGILVIVTPQTMTEVEEIAWRIVAEKQKGPKPIYANFIGGELAGKANVTFFENGVPFFDYPERAVRAFRFQTDFAERNKREIKPGKKHANHKVARSVLSFHQNQIGHGAVSSLLRLYDIPMAESELARNEKEVAEAFTKIKPPVVIKIASPDILHKTDVGGVLLGIETEEEAVRAYQKIIENVKRHKPSARIEGVTVMKMAKEGLEIILGAKRDAEFGPVLMFGFGGILVELIADFAVCIGPFDEKKVKELIGKTKVARVISGYRSAGEYSERKIAKAVLGLGKLITEHPEINSIEINPLVVEDGGGVIGLDAKIDIVSHKS